MRKQLGLKAIIEKRQSFAFPSFFSFCKVFNFLQIEKPRTINFCLPKWFSLLIAKKRLIWSFTTNRDADLRYVYNANENWNWTKNGSVKKIFRMEKNYI